MRQGAQAEGVPGQPLRAGVQPQHPRPPAAGDAAIYAERRVPQPRVIGGPHVVVRVQAEVVLGQACRPGRVGVVELATLKRSSSSRPKSSGHCRQPRYGCGLASSAFSARGRLSSRPSGAQFRREVLRHAVVDHLDSTEFLGRGPDRVKLRGASPVRRPRDRSREWRAASALSFESLSPRGRHRRSRRPRGAPRWRPPLALPRTGSHCARLPFVALAALICPETGLFMVSPIAYQRPRPVSQGGGTLDAAALAWELQHPGGNPR